MTTSYAPNPLLRAIEHCISNGQNEICIRMAYEGVDKKVIDWVDEIFHRDAQNVAELVEIIERNSRQPGDVGKIKG